MNLKSSSLYKEVKKTYSLKTGDIHLFNHFIVAEFKEEVNLCFESIIEIIEILQQNFNLSSPFGFISNRINSYSIILTDVLKLKDELKNLSAYAVVTYSEATKRNLEIEGYFLNFNRKHFNSLHEAKIWVEKELTIV